MTEARPEKERNLPSVSVGEWELNLGFWVQSLELFPFILAPPLGFPWLATESALWNLSSYDGSKFASQKYKQLSLDLMESLILGSLCVFRCFVSSWCLSSFPTFFSSFFRYSTTVSPTCHHFLPHEKQHHLPLKSSGLCLQSFQFHLHLDHL